jgi:glycerol-3-phosphate dehydrogenase
MYAYDLLTMGKNAGIADSGRRIGATRFLSRRELLGLFPELEQPSLTGGAVFDDGQMYNAARLVLAYVKSAARGGAQVANYVEATEFLWDGKTVRGVKVRDRLDDHVFDIRAGLVLNAAGPWAEYLLADATKFGIHQRGYFSRDAYFIIDRRPRCSYALAVSGQSRDRDSLVSRSARHLFAVPWRDYTLIGVWHRPFSSRPDSAVVEEGELESWIAEMNASHPALSLRREEICYACAGLVPFGSDAADTSELSFGKESRLIDHRRAHGVAGLVTLIGIRYTTARGDASVALDLLLQQRPGPAPLRIATDREPLVGGNIADFAALLGAALSARPGAISARSLEALVYNHGSEYGELLEIATHPAESQRMGDSDTLRAEVTHAVREEMAVRLEDIVFRRTNLGSGAHPGRAALEQAAIRAQQLFGWSDQRREGEIEATENLLRRRHAQVATGVPASPTPATP